MIWRNRKLLVLSQLLRYNSLKKNSRIYIRKSRMRKNLKLKLLNMISIKFKLISPKNKKKLRICKRSFQDKRIYPMKKRLIKIKILLNLKKKYRH